MSAPVQFRLEQFDSSLTLTQQGVLPVDTVIPDPDYDAYAVLNVNTNDLKEVFKFQTDDRNINNLNRMAAEGASTAVFDDVDLKYYTFFGQSWPNQLRINPANAMMNVPIDVNVSNNETTDAGPIGSYTNVETYKQLLKHDYMRHVAKHVFGTHFGVDLFANNTAVLDNLSYLSGDVHGTLGVFGQIEKSLRDIDVTSGTGSFMQTDSEGRKFLTNATSIDIEADKANIVRQLMVQIAMNAPERFAEISQSDTFELHSVPLQTGDIIKFRLTVSAADGQESITNVATPVPDRTYLICLVLSDSAENTAVVDSAYPSDTPYSGINTTIVYYDNSILGSNTDSSASAAPSAPVASMEFMDGLYFKNSTAGSAITWNVPVDNSFNASDLKTLYVTLNIGQNSSTLLPLGALPKIIINTDGGDYECTPDSSAIKDNYHLQLRYDVSASDNVDNLIQGFEQIPMTVGSAPAGSDRIRGVTLQSDPSTSANSLEIMLTSVGLIQNASKEVLYLSNADPANL